MSTQDRVWKVGAAVGVILAVFLAVLTIKQIMSLSYVGRDVPIMNSISVNGKGEEIIIPDVATFSFTVTESAKVVADAQKLATDKINKALEAVRAEGIADKDIKTTAYNINPKYEYQEGACTTYSCRPGKQVLTGYEVSQTVEVKIRELAKAGSILSTIGSLGVQNVNSLSFSVDDMDAVKARARTVAIDNAQTKAKELARQLGVKIVRITNYYDSSDNQMPLYGLGGAEDSIRLKTSSAIMAPQIPTGEQKVTSNVTITYQIR